MSAARRLAGPLLAAAAVASYTAVFRRYGIFDLADEGTLLVQALRSASGQVPYIDFKTGYGPVFFLLQGHLLRLGGVAAIRAALVVTHALAAALVYALGRRLFGAPRAALAVFVGVAFFLPIAPAKGAPFNVPYPAWYAGLAVVLATALLTDDGAPRWNAFFAGMIAGVTFAVKPNSGGLILVGAVAAIVLDGPERAGVVGRAALLGAALAMATLVASGGVGPAFWIFTPLGAALAWLGGVHGAPDRVVVPRLAAAGGGFALAAGMLLAPPFLVLGPAQFAREVLLIGAHVGRLYAQPLAWPALVAATVGLLAFFAPRRLAAPLLVLGALAVAVPLVRGAPRGVAGLRTGVEQALLVGVPVVLWGALALVRREAARGLVVLAAMTTAAALQLYPRADFLHLMPLGPLLVLLALAVAREVLARFGVSARVTTALVVGVAVLAALGRLAPTALVARDVLAGRTVDVVAGGTRFTIEPDGADVLRALAGAVMRVEELTGARDTVIGFPACGIVTFLADRLPAGPHDYFFPGRPDRAEAAVLALELGADRPPAAVTCSVAGTDLAGAWTYYPEFAGLIDARYRLALDAPPFKVFHVRPPVRRAVARRQSTNSLR